MKYNDALLQARTISEMLDIKDKLKQLKQDRKINNRQYSEMMRMFYDRYRGVLDEEIRKTNWCFYLCCIPYISDLFTY